MYGTNKYILNLNGKRFRDIIVHIILEGRHYSDTVVVEMEATKGVHAFGAVSMHSEQCRVTFLIFLSSEALLLVYLVGTNDLTMVFAPPKEPMVG